MRLLAALLFIAVIPAVASAGTVSACGTLSSADYYTVTQNITTSGSCFSITSANVVLDCAGFALISPFGGTGVSFGALSNVTVKNCLLENFTSGVTAGDDNTCVSNSAVEKNHFYVGAAAANMFRCIEFRNNTMTTTGTAIVGRRLGRFRSNVIYTSGNGIRLEDGPGNYVVDNNTIIGVSNASGTAFVTSGNHGLLSGTDVANITSNLFQGIGTGINIPNADSDGRVIISNNTFRNITTAITGSSWSAGDRILEGNIFNFSSVNTRVSINSTDRVVISNPCSGGCPADPATGGLKNISEYVSISGGSVSYQFAIYYDSTGITSESTIRAMKRVGSNWVNGSDISGTTVTLFAADNYILINTTNLSTWAPMGFPDTTKPTISNVSAVNHNDTSVTVTWNTDESSNTSVNYGTTLSLGTTSGVDDLVTFHSRALYGLSASTVYFFNVTSCDSAGNCNTTGNSSQLPFNFTTLPSGSTGGSTDTDGDGLTDVEEVSIYGTNASAADTDGDGFADGQEVAVGSNPLDALSYARVSVVKIAPAYEAAEVALFLLVALAIAVFMLLAENSLKPRK
jgi:hypothetical protein